MANNITIRQLNNGVYDSLLPRTTASKSYLTNDTSALYNLQNGTAEQAIQAIMRVIALSGNVSMRITDANGNPVVGAIVNGLVGSPISDENGNVQGIYEYTPVNIVSPYVDLQDKSVDVKNYVGSINVLTVQLDTYAENTVRRYTDSRNVRFSKMVKTVDVCCVGGGGGGANYAQYYGDSQFTTYQGSGGGGGGIVNAFGMTIATDENYPLYVGSGGATRGAGQSDSSGYDGGSSNFLGISANGGGGGVAKWYLDGSQHMLSVSAGKAGYAGCGDGGYADGSGQKSNVGSSNTTVSEFNDNAKFYSGGGGSGSGARKAGGTPNGAAGAYQNRNTAINATTAGIGGGGGGGMTSRLTSGSYITGYASAGGPGLVAIRFHF